MLGAPERWSPFRFGSVGNICYARTKIFRLIKE
jgi:hypothetical protein